MRKILIAAVLLVAPAYAADNPEAAIKAAVLRIDTCVANKDMKCLGELFADDATFGGPDNAGKLLTGKSAILASFDKRMKESAMDGVKQVRTVEKLRLMGNDRALVDTSVKLSGAKDLGEGEGQAWHAVMSVRLEGGKWLLEDVRSYVVVTGQPPTPGPTFAPLPTEPTKAPQPEKPADAAEPAKP